MGGDWHASTELPRGALLATALSQGERCLRVHTYKRSICPHMHCGRACRRALVSSALCDGAVKAIRCSHSSRARTQVPGPPDSVSSWSKAMSGAERLSALQGLLQPRMLRRTKMTRDAQNEPIVQLPPRRTRLLLIPFSAAEADFYRALHSRSKTQFDAYVAEGKALSNYASVLELLLRLRQTRARVYSMTSP